MERFQVTIDPELEPIIPRYMELRRQELEDLDAAVGNADAEAVRLLGHKLKGTGASYGFQALTDLGAAIESAGRGNDLHTAARLALELRDYLDNVDIIYAE